MLSNRIDELLVEIDSELERLHTNVKNCADIVISADHGHIDAGDAVVITAEHELMDFLQVPPFGEPRAAQFLVKTGM